jgi:hypothetical protein
MLREIRAKSSVLKLAGLMIATAIGVTSAPTSAVADGAQQDQQIPPKFEVGPIPQSILDVQTKGDFI